VDIYDSALGVHTTRATLKFHASDRWCLAFAFRLDDAASGDVAGAEVHGPSVRDSLRLRDRRVRYWGVAASGGITAAPTAGSQRASRDEKKQER
jgi:hypothetical protein